jgi:mannose-6-phosphate isomerase-like protein (cupin superfamily)
MTDLQKGGIVPERSPEIEQALQDTVVQRHAERPRFQITELRLGPTQQVPWHCQTNIQDTFCVLEGRVRVILRQPEDKIDLAAGESWGPVRPGRPHLVTHPGQETATYLVLGMGDYDFVTLPNQERQ